MVCRNTKFDWPQWGSTGNFPSLLLLFIDPVENLECDCWILPVWKAIGFRNSRGQLVCKTCSECTCQFRGSLGSANTPSLDSICCQQCDMCVHIWGIFSVFSPTRSSLLDLQKEKRDVEQSIYPLPPRLSIFPPLCNQLSTCPSLQSLTHPWSIYSFST